MWRCCGWNHSSNSVILSTEPREVLGSQPGEAWYHGTANTVTSEIGSLWACYPAEWIITPIISHFWFVVLLFSPDSILKIAFTSVSANTMREVSPPIFFVYLYVSIIWNGVWHREGIQDLFGEWKKGFSAVTLLKLGHVCIPVSRVYTTCLNTASITTVTLKKYASPSAKQNICNPSFAALLRFL